jgi:hypothetical protein
MCSSRAPRRKAYTGSRRCQRPLTHRAHTAESSVRCQVADLRLNRRPSRAAVPARSVNGLVTTKCSQRGGPAGSGLLSSYAWQEAPD